MGAVLLVVQLGRRYAPPLECVFEGGIHKHVEARKSSPSVIPQVLFTLFWETGSFIVLDLDSSTRLTGHKVPGVCLLLPAKQPYDCAGAPPCLAFHVFLFIICVCEGCKYGLTHAPAHTEAMALKEAERILSLQTASRVFCLQKGSGVGAGGDDTLSWPQGAPATLMENLGTRLS